MPTVEKSVPDRLLGVHLGHPGLLAIGAPRTVSGMSSEPESAFDAGITTRRQVMGDEFVDRALARTRGTESEPIQRFVTEHVWDAVWNRPGLSRRDRSLLNLGMLTALRAHEELAGHVRGGLNNGLTREEIVEAIIHATGYCGAPAALSARRVVQQVLDEIP